MSSQRADTERVTAATLAELPGVVAITVEESARCWRTIHDGYTVCAVMPPKHGLSHGEIRYRGWSYEVRPGQVLLMEPGELHITTSMRGTASFRLFHLAADALGPLLGTGSGGGPHWRAPFVEDARLIDALCAAHAGFARADDAQRTMVLLGRALLQLTMAGAEPRHASRAALVRREVNQAARLLRARYQDHPALDELARETGLTRYRLVQLFSEQLGLSPMQYLLEVRLREARARLAEGRSVADAAHESGFYDQAQLAKLFKRASGMTPSEFRAALQGGRATVRRSAAAAATRITRSA